MIKRWWLVGALAVAVAVACGTAGPSMDGGEASGGGSGRSFTIVQKAFDAEGGSLTHPGGLTLRVPPGALATTTTITIKGLEVSAKVAGGTAVSQTFLFGPEGLRFAKSVEVAVPVEDELLPNGATHSSVSVFLGSGSTTSLQYEFVGAQTVSVPTRIEGDHVVATISHFSAVAAVVPSGGALSIAPGPAVTGQVGAPLSAALVAMGGTVPYAWSAFTSEPKGLVLSTAGVLSGTPLESGASTFVATVRDSTGRGAERLVEVHIEPASGGSGGGAGGGGGSGTGGSGGGAGSDAGRADAGASDGGRTDAGATDAGATDAGRPDGGTDGGVRPDGGSDAGASDGGSSDAGGADAGRADGGVSDAGSSDAGAADAGRVDAGLGDAGLGDAGLGDAGLGDAGLGDAGRVDAGADAGRPDAGANDGG